MVVVEGDAGDGDGVGEESVDEVPSYPLMYSIAADMLGELTMTDPRCPLREGASKT